MGGDSVEDTPTRAEVHQIQTDLTRVRDSIDGPSGLLVQMAVVRAELAYHQKRSDERHEEIVKKIESGNGNGALLSPRNVAIVTAGLISLLAAVASALNGDSGDVGAKVIEKLAAPEARIEKHDLPDR